MADPIKRVFESFTENGFPVQLQKKCADGTYENASEREFGALRAKARLASTADALKSFSIEEKTKWAVEMKDYANELFKNGFFKEAEEKYIEAIVASEFGEGVCQPGNIDTVTVPALSNLVACAMKLKQWVKAHKLCDQLLLLRPKNYRNLIRLGIVKLNLSEFESARVTLHNAAKIISVDLECIPEEMGRNVDITSSSSIDQEQEFELLQKQCHTSREKLMADKERILILLNKVISYVSVHLKKNVTTVLLVG